jgi:predicted DNA-binding transcriptional regulator YafY
MRSDRLLALLLLLQAHRQLPARELAGRLEVSERTIHRDVESLSAAGVPVYAERGRRGGVALLPGYRTDVSGLSASEARALFVFAGRGTLADLGLERDLRGALRKLLAALPEAQRPDAMQAQSLVVVDPQRWMRPADELPHLGTVQEAVWQDRRLLLTYRRPGAEARAVELDPYGLVSKAGTWYLIGAPPGGDPRLYRVSRIEAAELMATPARRPQGLDLERLWEELRGRVEERGAGVEVRLRVRTERAQMLLRLVAGNLVAPPGQPAPAAPGWSSLALQFVAEPAAAGMLLGFGADVEVLAPVSLRQRMAAGAAAVVALYSDPP